MTATIQKLTLKLEQQEYQFLLANLPISSKADLIED